MDESYKISLGVEVDVDDIQSQINKADVKPIPIKVEIENLNEIKQQLQNLGNDSKNSLTLNTSGVESALNDVKSIIVDIKKSLGTIDGGNGMKDLLSSINQIAKALGKAEDESQNLVNSLNALSKKDFSLNLGINMGGKSFNNIAYGREARRTVLPQLKQQSEVLTKMLGGEGKTLLKLASKYSDVDMFTYLPSLDTGSIIEQMERYETHINRLKKLVVDGGGSLSSFNAQFSKSATELIDDVTGLSKSADVAEESVKKLTNLFGGGNTFNVDGLDEQLNSIVADLSEIKKVLSGLSEGVSIDKITQSLKEMSDILDTLTKNLNVFKDGFGNVDNGLGSPINGVVQELKNGESVLDSFKQSLKNIGMSDEEIDSVANSIKNLGVQIEALNQKKRTVHGKVDENGKKISDDKEILTVDISGIDQYGNAIKLTQEYDLATKQLISSIDKVSTVHQKAGKSAETFAKQQQRAVTDLTNQINQVNRSAIDQNAARPIKETEHLNSLKAKYDEIIAAIARMGTASNETFEDERNKVKTLIAEYKSLKSEYKNAENVALEMDGNDFASGLEIAKNRLAEFKSQAQGLSQMSQTIKELDTAIESVGDVSSLKEFNNQLRVAKSELSKVKAETAGVSDIRLKLADKGFNGFEQEVQRVKNAVSALKQASPDLQEALRRLDTAMDAVSAADKAEDFQRLKVANEAYEKALKQVYSQLKLNQQAENNELKKASFEAAKEGALLRLKGLFSENSQAARRFGSELDRIQKELNECGDSKGLTRINREITNLSRDIKNANVLTQTFGERFKKQWSQYTSYFSVASLFSYATQGLRSMFEQVKLIDSAMTELKKVTNETDATYNKFLSNAADRAKAIGTTIDGLVSSTADFARLGYGFEDAQGLAEVANIYAVVGDEIDGVQGATESLISTMAAFKDAMNGMSNTDFAMSIIDKFNEIGNNFAISSGGIGEALERSASSLMAANNTIDESIALITAANTVVQDPTAVGTAFKTISMRIRGAKTELEEAGLETDGMVESTATLRAEIEALAGVDIMEADGKTFKSTYAILDELSKKWKYLSDIQQATVTELIAGKRQGNIVSSLMANFDTARDALETSINSSGSAMAEHEKWQKSLEAQINNLKAAWQSLSQTFLKSEFLKSGIDVIIKFIDVLTKLIDKIGTLPTLLGAFAIFKTLPKLFSIGKQVGGIKQLVDITQVLQLAFPNITKAAKKLVTSLREISYASGGAGSALHGFMSLILQHPYITAAVIAVTALTAAFAHQRKKAKELAEEVDELTSKFQEQQKELQKLKSDYDTSDEDSMISKYGELSKGVDHLGRNVSLTADEYSEYQNIVNKIADQIPSLVTGYDEQGNALLNVKGNVEELIAAYENLIEAQSNEVLNKSKNIADDFKNAVDDRTYLGQKNPFNKKTLLFDDIEILKNAIEDGKATYEELRKAGGNSGKGYSRIQYAIESASLDWSEGAVYNIADIQRIIDGFYGEFETEIEGMKSIPQAILNKAFDIRSSDYYGMSDTLKGVVNQIINGFDDEFYIKYKGNSEGLIDYVYEVLDQLNSINKDENATIETAFNLKTQFNNGDVTYGEYAEGIQNAKDIIDGLDLDDEVKSSIKLSLDDGEIQTQYNHIREYLRDFYTNKDTRNMDRDEEYDYKFKAKENDKKVKKFLDSLTANELAAVIDLKTKIDWENTSVEDIRKQIEDQVKLNEALNFDANIEVDKTALEAFNTALEESASAIGLSEESIDSLRAKYSDLEGYNPHTLFEKTANGVKINREELAKLEKKYNDLTKTEVQEHLDTLVEEYNKCTKAIDGNIGSQEKLELIAKREKYAQQIEELAEYQAQLEGVTGAYQRWIDAQNTPEDYEGYQAVATSREDIEDEISRGFLSNSTKEYIDLLSGKDLVGGSIDDYYNAWKKLDEKVGSTSYSIHDFFTVNDDGDITSTGIDRFFKGLQQDFKGSVAKFNEESGKWEYDFSQENLQKIQDEWGLGIEAIELLLEAAAAAGYDVDWGGIFDDLDLDTSNFESLVSVAEQAQKELNKLKGYEDLDFNFSTTTVEAATLELEKAQKTYNELVTGADGKININAEGADNARVILATLLVQKQQLEDSEIAINISTSGLDESQAKAVAWVQDFRTKYKNLEIAISTGEGIEEAKTELETVKTSLGELDGDTAKIAAQLVLGEGADSEGFKTQVNSAIDSIGEQKINVGFNLNETAISDLNSNLLSNFTVDATAKITNVDKSQLETVETSGMVTWQENVDGVSKSFEATGTVNWDDDVKNVKTSFSANGTVNWTSGNNVKVKVISEANGTANANGTTSSRAFARGNWSIKGSGTALVGELGMETLVRGGHFYTIGDNGAEFIKYKQGDIIFNHKQTEELFKYGKVTSDSGRGRMFVNGSAFVDGSYPSNGEAFWQASASTSKFATLRDGSAKKKTNKKKNSSKDTKIEVTVKDDGDTKIKVGGSKATVSENNFAKENQNKAEKDSKDKFEETFDWVAIAIERIEREIDNLDKRVNDSYSSWGARNADLTNEIIAVGEEIAIQSDAANEYLKKANSVGLDPDYALRIQEGSLDIENFEGENDEALVEKIKEYQKWYELYLQCKDAAVDLKRTEAELYEQRFELVQAQYDGILQGFEHTESMLNEYIAQAEAKGYIVSKEYYQALINNEKNNISELKEEQSALIRARDEAVASGRIVKGSQAWYDMCADIDAVTQSIEEGNTALIEYSNSIRDIEWQVFDLMQERISDVTKEADFLIDLMSYDKLFDDNGKLTDKGLATMGLHGQNYNTYMYAADDYAKEIAKLDKQIAKDPYDQELINRRRELVELQRESILAAEDEKRAIVDLVEEGINLELEALQERIDLHNEELESMKDIYDYQKNVQKQSEEIASLEKQRAAYMNDDSEESKAKLQEITVSLKEAKEDLQETEYDRYISDQQQLLDSLYEEYELILNQRLDNVDALLTQVIDAINIAAGAEGTIATALGSEGVIAGMLSNNTTTIKTSLENEAKGVGTTLSTAMKGIWSVDEGNAKSVITEYGKGFQEKQTTTNTVLGDIKAYINRMVDDVDKDAKEDIKDDKTDTSGNDGSTKDTKPPKTNPPKTEEPKRKITNDTLMGIASSIWVYGKDSGWGNNPFREDKLTKKIGAANAKKVQDYVNKYGASGKLHDFWIKHKHNLDMYKYSAFASGSKYIDESQLAWTQEKGQEFIIRPSDGAILTPIAKGDSVLTSTASNNIWDMANSPAEFIKENLKLGEANVPNNSNVNNTYSQHIDNVVFRMDNIKNYNELLSEMQKDKNFEKLILSMSIDRLAGKSSLAKNKSIR